MAFDDYPLDESYFGDLDYGRLSHSHSPSGLVQPSFPSVRSDNFDQFSDSVFEDPEVDESSVFSPFALSREAETLLVRYLGDLYGVNKESVRVDSLSGGQSSMQSDLFYSDSSLANDPGIKLPPVFASEFDYLDSLKNTLKPVPSRAQDSFHFVDEEQSRFFSTKLLAPDTEAFGHSLKALSANLLCSKEYHSADKGWRFVSKASSYSARLAVFATALVELLFRTDELEVTEEDRIAIRAILMEISVLSYSQAARIQLHATQQRRLLALETLNLPKDFNSHAVDRIPRVGQHIFGGKFLEAVDSDLSMNKRAREVTDKFKPRHSDSFRKPRGGRSFHFPSFGRYRGQRSRGRGQSRYTLSCFRGGSGAKVAASNPPSQSTK